MSEDALTCDQCGSAAMVISYEVENLDGGTDIVCPDCLVRMVRKIEAAELN